MPHLEQIAATERQRDETIARLTAQINSIFATPLSFGGGKARLSQSRSRARAADNLRAQIERTAIAADEEIERLRMLDDQAELIAEIMPPAPEIPISSEFIDPITTITPIQEQQNGINLRNIAIIGGVILLLG